MSTADASNSSEEYINTSLLQDDDILEALPPESRDTVGMRDFHRYWDGKGEQKLRELHKMCGTVSVLWEVPARAEGDDKIYATVAQFWRYAEIVGLTHVGGLAELTKFMRPETEGSVNVPPPAQQRLTVADFAFGILQIASKLTTVKMCARYYGIGDDKDFITDRLEALLKGISNETGRLLDCGEPFSDDGAASIFRGALAPGVRSLLEVLCDEDGTVEVAAAKKLLLSADALSSKGAGGGGSSQKRNLGSIALAMMAAANAAPRPPKPNELLETLRRPGVPRPKQERVTGGEVLDAMGRHAMGSCPDLTPKEAIAKIWGPLLGVVEVKGRDDKDDGRAASPLPDLGPNATWEQQQLYNALAEAQRAIADADSAGQAALLSAVSPPEAVDSRLRALLHEVFVHYASYAWHRDAAALHGPASLLIKHTAWRVFAAQLRLGQQPLEKSSKRGRDLLSLARGESTKTLDAPFYACCESFEVLHQKPGGGGGNGGEENDEEGEDANASGESSGRAKTVSALDEAGCLAALRMLASNIVLTQRQRAGTIAAKTAAHAKAEAAKAAALLEDEIAAAPKPDEEEEPPSPTQQKRMPNTSTIDDLIAQKKGKPDAAAKAKADEPSSPDKERSAHERRQQQIAHFIIDVDRLLGEALVTLRESLGLAKDGDVEAAKDEPATADSPTPDSPEQGHAGMAPSPSKLHGPPSVASFDHLASSAHAQTLLETHPDELTLLFHAYAKPLEPRQPSVAAALAATADTGASAERLARSFGADEMMFASELRGVGPDGLRQLFEDFSLSRTLNTGEKWATQAAMKLEASGPLSLLQLCLLLLQGYAHGAARDAAKRSLEIDGLDRNQIEAIGLQTTKKKAPEEAGIRAVAAALNLHAAAPLFTRLLAFGRRLAPAALLLPLPEEPLVLLDAGAESLAAMGQESLARRLHALVALADADDPRVIGHTAKAPPQAQVITNGVNREVQREFRPSVVDQYYAQAHSKSLTNSASAPHITPLTPRNNDDRGRHYGSRPNLLQQPLSMLAIGADATTATTAALAASTCELINQPLTAPPNLPAAVGQVVQQAALLARDGDQSGSLAALRRARVLYAELGFANKSQQSSSSMPSPLQRSSSMRMRLGSKEEEEDSVDPNSLVPYPPAMSVFLALAMARAMLQMREPRKALVHAGTAWFCAIYAPPDDPCHLEVTCALGSITYELGRYDVAAALYARALEARAAMSDEEGPGLVMIQALDIGECFNNLGACAAAVDDPCAEKLYRHAHALLVAELKPSHPALLTVLHNLSRTLSLPVPGGIANPLGWASQLQIRQPPTFFQPMSAAAKKALKAAKGGGKKGGGKKGGGKSGKKKK